LYKSEENSNIYKKTVLHKKFITISKINLGELIISITTIINKQSKPENKTKSTYNRKNTGKINFFSLFIAQLYQKLKTLIGDKH